MSFDESVPVSAAEQHGFTIARRRRWPLLLIGAIVVVAVVAVFVIARTSGSTSPNETAGATLSVVYLDSNPAEKLIIEYIAENIAADYDVKVAAVGLGDSTQINQAVSDGRYAGTIFQHRHWLQQVLDANPGFREEAATGPFFHWVFGIWSDKYKRPQDLPEGASVSLPTDPANNAQAIWYLAQAGLVTLRPEADITALTQKDIVGNPKNLTFTMLDLGAQPRALRDLDAIVGYAESFLAAGVPEDKLIFAPKSPDEFASVLTVGSDYVDTQNIKNLIKAFEDPRVQTYIANDPEVKKLALPGDPT
ncbi:metal ABC transporter substrate-binding protein [Mycolicibacterium novocastrense]|uniref:MetQ/NlpA family ABC transporter substrate-binding protein n=1 Tax=Mycolicibacterium novocastrense TaxID=59813 RepID=UPI000749F4C0|nr:metal ABC transporter substrate-binding protein [Mycolicibacterium novocastrense]KUH68516.1 metal ABC transporter substrate-binding protein [Mycolicibacterium novocastrense]KUH73722.1 metal ABC transporter substrate-binding protein [Mycolicibacterium novocastrense]